ncbi:MAG: Holliday junction resolvase RuvX [Candidatus Aminicenantes bacterium]|nr:Holliday junction resolvase RuvX [Candidatus Aminicenantes bacterium]
MRILAIDYGDKNIGLAVSDPLFLTAQSLGRYKKKTAAEDAFYFRQLSFQYDIKEVVIGLPLRMDGSEGSRAEITRRFGRWLKEVLNIPVFFWDERLTTKEALDLLSLRGTGLKEKKQKVDQVSAALILSSYLEKRKAKNHDPESG